MPAVYYTHFRWQKENSLYSDYYFGICLLDLMAGSVFLLMTNYDMVNLFDDRKTAIIANSLSISVLAAITVISVFIRKRNEKKGYITSQRIGIFYLLLIVLGEMAISLFITAFQLEGSGNKADRKSVV